jgi:tellurite resistance protein TerC
VQAFLAAAENSNVYSYDVSWIWWASLAVALVGYAILEWYHTKKDHAVKFDEAVKWTIFYISVAILYSIPIFIFIGNQAGAEYLAALATEKALSLDNLFVIGLIFTQLKVPEALQRRMLNYGIAGAIFFRMLFIIGGIALLQRFEWISVVFGVILLQAAYHAFKDAKSGSVEEGEKKLESRMWKLLTRLLPISDRYEGHKLLTRVNGKLMLTMMAAGILMVELTDIVFAVDSVPAVLAITPDKFIAYSSNVFAILGMRALFFVYRAVEDKFWALNWGLAFILTWIGLKLVGLPFGLHVLPAVSLGVLFACLFFSITISLLVPPPKHRKAQ